MVQMFDNGITFTCMVVLLLVGCFRIRIRLCVLVIGMVVLDGFLFKVLEVRVGVGGIVCC